jgi:hypothetical protein
VAELGEVSADGGTDTAGATGDEGDACRHDMYSISMVVANKAPRGAFRDCA